MKMWKIIKQKEILNKIINNILKDENEENESNEDYKKLISYRKKI